MTQLPNRSRNPNGRPKGAKNIVAPVVPVLESRCPACGSTRREQYFNRRDQAVRGTLTTGETFTHIVWRRTACADCGQVRDDKWYENRP